MLWFRARDRSLPISCFSPCNCDPTSPPFRYLFIYNFYWSIVDLQCCLSFCCIVKWTSYTYIHSLLDSFPYRSFPFYLLQLSLTSSWSTEPFKVPIRLQGLTFLLPEEMTESHRKVLPCVQTEPTGRWSTFPPSQEAARREGKWTTCTPPTPNTTTAARMCTAHKPCQKHIPYTQAWWELLVLEFSGRKRTAVSVLSLSMSMSLHPSLS